MQNILIQTRDKILSQIITLDDSQPDLGIAVITFLHLQTQLLNLSYLPINQYGYLRIISAICRPQTIIEIGDTSLISITLILIYLAYMVIPLKGKKFVSLIGLVLETAILNFFIETAKYPQFYLLLFLLIVVQLIRAVIIDGQLDIEIINFQYIKQSWINRAIKLLRFVQIFNFYDFQLIISTTIAFLYVLRNFTQQQPLQYIKLSMQINILTLYYSFLVALDFDQQFSTEIIIIPFLFKISSYIVQRMAYKNNYSLDDIFTLIIQQQNVILKKKHQLNHLTLDQAIVKLLSKDPLRRKNFNFEDSVIYASSLMKFDKKFDALKYILILEEINQPIITSLKLKRLHTKCLKQIFRKMEQKQIIVGKMVKDLMYAEHQNYTLYHQIVNLILKKINFLKLLDQQKIHKSQILEMNRQIISIKDELLRYHDRTQSNKSQSILIFYQCEILNDLIEPQLRHSQSLKSSGYDHFLGSQFLTDKMIYLITEYQENLIIKRHSNNTQEILMKQDIINEKVDLFLPIAVQNVHKQLVEQMFDDGHSKFMRNLNDNILKLPNGFLITIEFALDVLFIKDTLQFVVFIQQSINQPMKMAADQDFIINHISDNVCQYIKPFQLIGRSLQEFIPNFEMAIENEDYLVFNQVEILKNKYLAQLSVFTKKLQQRPVYFIIQIITIRSIINQDDNSFRIQQQNESLDEDIEILNPNIFNNDLDLPIYTQRITSPKSTFIVPFIQNQEQNFFVTRQKLDSDLTSNQQHMKSKQQVVYKKTNASSKYNIQKSSFYKKYELVLKSGLLQGFSKLHQILLALLLLLLATQQSVQVSQFITVNNSMKSIISDVEMLQIKNLIFQPLEAFLLTRWNILSYNNLYSQGLINQTYLQSLLVFPYGNLILGYDDLSFNIKNSQNYKGLSVYYDETKINVSLYNNTNQGQVYLFTLRESLDILLNYQYIIKKRYQIEGSVILDSPYVYFTYKNLINLNNVFTEINNQVFQNSVYKSEILIDSVQTLLIVILVVLAMFTLIIIYYYIKIEKKTFQYLSLLFSVDRDSITSEITRLQLLHRSLSQNNDKIFNYKLNIDVLEQQFSTINSSYQKNKKKQINFKKSYINSISIGLIITYFFIIGYSIFGNYYARQFLNQYPQTAKLYMDYSVIGTDVPTIYAMREVLYNRNLFPFYQTEQLQQTLDQISQSLITIKDFTNMQYSKEQLIMSDSFYDYLININAQNLCFYFKKALNDLSYSLCRNSMDGTINRGLRELLVYIQNSIQNEIIINKFTQRLQPFQIGELEGAFITSYLIKIINKNFNIDIFQQTTNQNSLAQTLMLIFTILLFAFQIYFILSIKFIHQREYYLQQRIVYLIPRHVLLFDDTFERNLRSLFTQEIIQKQ